MTINVQENVSKQLLLILTLVFTSFFTIIFTGNRSLIDALFVYTQGPIVYALKYYFSKNELEDEIVGAIITYILAMLFYFVLTGTIDFILLLYAFIVYLLIRRIVMLINIKNNSPVILLLYSLLIGLFAALIISLTYS